MASTEALHLTPLAEDSIPGCMALSAEAGWNQTPDDWAVFMRRGTVFGLLDGGAPVASGAILPYPNDFAWISMVLVTAKQAPRTHRHAHPGDVLRRDCAARLGGDARRYTRRRARLSSARIRADVRTLRAGKAKAVAAAALNCPPASAR